MICLAFVIEPDISLTPPGTSKYSCISWHVGIDKDAGMDVLNKGQRVVVSSVVAGIFQVKAS